MTYLRSRHLRGFLSAGFCLAAIGSWTGLAQGQERAPDVIQQAPPTVLVHPVTANVTVTDQQLLNADRDQDNWLLHGRTYDNADYSPLTGINPGNINQLAPVPTIHTG